MKILNFKTILFLISTLLLTKSIHSQNKNLCIGYKNNGLCFGNPENLNGLNINLFDKNIHSINGCQIAFGCSTTITNGISFGLLGVNSKYLNGLAIGGIGIGTETKFNGLGIAGISIYSDTLSGVFISLYGNTKWNHSLIKEMNGLAIGGLVGINCETINGVVIGALNYSINQNGLTIGIINSTENLNGIQIGLWNVAINKKRFKKMPLINFCFKKNYN
jgi:hypothetical protein